MEAQPPKSLLGWELPGKACINLLQAQIHFCYWSITVTLSWLTWSLGKRGKRFCSPSYWKTMDRRKTMTTPSERLPSPSMRSAKTDDIETRWSKIILYLFAPFSEVPTDLLTNAICDQLFSKPYYIYLELSLHRILCWLGRRCGNTFDEAMSLNLLNDFKTAFSFIRLMLKTFYSSRVPPGFQDLFVQSRCFREIPTSWL